MLTKLKKRKREEEEEENKQLPLQPKQTPFDIQLIMPIQILSDIDDVWYLPRQDTLLGTMKGKLRILEATGQRWDPVGLIGKGWYGQDSEALKVKMTLARVANDGKKIILRDNDSFRMMALSLEESNFMVQQWESHPIEHVAGLFVHHEENCIYITTFTKSVIVLSNDQGKFIRGFKVSEKYIWIRILGNQLWGVVKRCKRRPALDDVIHVVDKNTGSILFELTDLGGTERIELGDLNILGELIVAVTDKIFFLNNKGQVIQTLDPPSFGPRRPFLRHIGNGNIILRGDKNKNVIVKIRQSSVMAFLSGFHERAGRFSKLYTVVAKHSLFDKQCLRLPLRLAGVLFKLS